MSKINSSNYKQNTTTKKKILNKVIFANEPALNLQNILTDHSNSPADWRDALCQDRACLERFDREGSTY